MQLRFTYLFLFIVGFAKPGFGQFYEVFGPRLINSCNVDINMYFIETTEQLVQTIWTIDPPTGTIIPDIYSAQIQFFSPGDYTLIATSFTTDQLTFVDTLLISVYGTIELPEVLGCYEFPDSSNACYRVCAHSQTTLLSQQGFSEFQVIGAESYVLDPNANVLEITWGAGGTGMVIILEPGCSAELCFDILPMPTADFSTTPVAVNDTLTVCKNQEVYFENLSFNGINYTWHFGDGEQSDSYDAAHTFGDEGFYTVTLLTNSICACSDEKQIVVEVLPSPAPTLDCVNTVCQETRQHYTASPSGCAQYIWSVSSNGTIVNGGEPTDDFIEVIWHEGPDGFIELSVSGCATDYCSFTNIFRIPIITPEGPIAGDASVCSGEISTYTAPYFPGTQYHWQIGPNGTILGGENTNNLTVQWASVNAPASSPVEVYYNNCFLECFGHDVINVTITPEIRLSGDAQVCENQSASVTAEAGFSIFMPVNVSWHIENVNGQILFSAPGLSSTFNHVFNYPPGEYAWVATNTNAGYCTELVRKSIFITATPPAPLGILGESIICPGQLYGYTIESAGDFATTWIVTDGATTYTYEGQSFQHAFGPAGPYIIQANHRDIQYMVCISDPVSLTLDTAADLDISGPDEGCLNTIDSFTTSYISGAEYQWEIIPADHGEIRRSNFNNVIVFWTQSGNATLRLTACGVSIDKVIFVHPLPAFTIVGPTSACANELVALTTDLPLLTHVWRDTSDQIISVLNNVLLPPGSFGVEVTDGNGCINKNSVQINSYPAPYVHLSTAFQGFFCATIPGGVNIVANTDGGGYSFIWYLDDIAIGLGGPIYNVTAFGSYHVEVTNQYGCKTVSQKIIFENCCPPATCGFGVPGLPNGCAMAAHDFDIIFSELECNVHTFTPDLTGVIPGSVYWSIRSNSEGVLYFDNTDILNYSYEKPGYYTIIITAALIGFPYDAAVCAHGQGLIDTVPAVADFASIGICAGAPISFEDLTTFLPSETIVSWSWDFGDPSSGAANSSTAQDPTHVFALAGSYEVTLTTTMASGCNTTKKHMVNISGGPELLPTYEPIFCEDEAMAFQLPGEAYDIVWTFGDPASGLENTAISDSVLHTFYLQGMYLVTVEGSDIHSCRSQTAFMVTITANTLSGLIAVDPILPLCAGDTATLTAPSGGLSWNWSTEETTSVIEVTESNQYSVLIQDQFGCTYSPPAAFVSVFPKPEVIIQAREIYGPDEFGPWSSSLEICAGTEFEISAFSTGNVTYHWSNGELTQVLQFTSEGSNLPDVGVEEYTVTTIDLSNGCTSDSSTIIIEIYELPQVPVISLVSGNSCSFNPNVLQVDNPEAGVTYTWSDGQEGISITTEQAGAYLVTAINQNGCAAISNTIIIEPSAQVDQIPGGCFIECDPLDVCLPPLSDVASYTIYQDGNVFLSGTSWPSDFVITADGSYTVEVTTLNGCVAISNPLDVILYTGVGSITIETWLDQDGDGVISGGDILLSGIPVEIISDDGLHSGKTETVPGGQFVFEDYPAADYLAMIDRTLLSSQYKVVIDSVTTQIATCGDSVVVSLLLMENCVATGPDQMVESCPGDAVIIGDSTWTQPGTYEMHMNSALGCDSVFQVIILAPDSIEINVVVWVDVDHSGMVSPVDTLIEGITIVMDRQMNVSTYTDITDVNGETSGLYPPGNYLVSVDSLMLPPGLELVFGVAFFADTVCGAVTFNFLLSSLCTGVFVIQQETLCPGDSIFVEGQWIDAAGQYTFVHSDPVTLCDTIIDVYVTMSAEIVVQSVVDWNCETNGSITLDISGNGPFIIMWGQGISGDTMITGLDPGDYTVMITDENECVSADTFTITASPGLTFDVPSVYMLNQGDSVLISILGDVLEPGISFAWTPSNNLSCPTCPTTWAYPLQSTTYLIQITDADSCVYLLQTSVVVTVDSSLIDQVYAPNVFSPNGDGINDHWTISSKLPETYLQDLAIYDRWGNMVFYKSEIFLNTTEGWDGTKDGKMMNPGVFVYVARLILGDGREAVLQGDVTLVR